jgi:hypothetical protein
MPSSIDEIVRRRVIQQWLSGEPRDKIASDLQIGAGTVSGIVSDYKKNLQGSDLGSVREFAVEAKKQGFTLSDLSAHIRLHNFFIKSGAAEDRIESFITNVGTDDVSPEKVVELVYQLHQISKAESIPPDQVSSYIQQKIQEKQNIEEAIKEADAILQSKNVNIEAINEHIQLNQKLKNYGLSTKDIHRLRDVLVAAKEYRYSPGKIVAKLRSIKSLENKENRLKNSCEILSKKEAKYKEIIPLANLIWDLHIGKNELISFKIAVNEAAEIYGLTPSAAALDVINVIKNHNKRGQLKKELSELTFHKYAINRFCSSRSQVIMALMNLQSHGVTEDQILYVNNLLEKMDIITSIDS